MTDGRVTEFRQVGGIGPDEILLRVSLSDLAGGETLLPDRLGLTVRDAKVLLWLPRGKANRDIAGILVLSPRTVNRHMEGISVKLGIEDRASATALAVRALGGA
ncbi:response regulator transcription factor [Roseomonas sp. CCTCC AB2023176]|uniref:response regulator transcription factor n=1 Tax=Roseomonas sp. CCTCC AB2023176 TaxID=3342640 RepID=UPI0035D7E3E4